VSYDSH